MQTEIKTQATNLGGESFRSQRVPQRRRQEKLEARNWKDFPRADQTGGVWMRCLNAERR